MTTLAPAQAGVYTVANSSDRSARFPTPFTGQLCLMLDTGDIVRYSGSAWVVVIGQSLATTNTVYVDDPAYAVAGDGVTNDSTAMQLALNSVPAGGILKGTPGKTYLLSATTAGALFKTAAAGVLLDFTGCVLKYGGAPNLTTGADGGSLGLVNILHDGCYLRGTIDCNSKAYYGVSIKSQVSGFRHDITIKNTVDDSSPWSGMHFAASSDVTGVAVSGRAKNVSGFLQRPSCPTSTAGAATVTGHADVTAIVIGGSAQATNATGSALVYAADAWTARLALIDKPAIQLTASLAETSLHWADLIVNDLGTQGLEVYGETVAAGTVVGLPVGSIPGARFKTDVHCGFYHYNTVFASTDPPNVDMVGGAAASRGVISLLGRERIGRKVLTWGTAPAVDARDGEIQLLTATTDVAAVMAAPSNPPTDALATYSQFLTIVFKNGTGGALATAITFNAAYKVSASVQPADGKYIAVTFLYHPADAVWVEISRGAAV
jgi:hypothetical protein